MFNISDISFEVEAAILDAYVDDDSSTLKWGIEILTSSSVVSTGPLRVKLSSEVLLQTHPHELASWKDLSKFDFNWSGPLNEDQEPFAILYAFEHSPVSEGRGHFYTGENDELMLKWSGRCDLLWNDQYGKDLEFVLETKVNFKGVWFGNEDENNSLAILRDYITQDNLVFEKSNGVSLVKCSR